ncbi:MAG: hypothetical protein KatS3mg117_0827 [Geminicoccaceae bacterium]|jgi:hypothetical protein|nr:MAG: hypothetical protein KatS3mg117_0827 [Geminicoccaceae bacterium]
MVPRVVGAGADEKTKIGLPSLRSRDEGHGPSFVVNFIFAELNAGNLASERTRVRSICPRGGPEPTECIECRTGREDRVGADSVARSATRMFRRSWRCAEPGSLRPVGRVAKEGRAACTQREGLGSVRCVSETPRVREVGRRTLPMRPQRSRRPARMQPKPCGKAFCRARASRSAVGATRARVDSPRARVSPTARAMEAALVTRSTIRPSGIGPIPPSRYPARGPLAAAARTPRRHGSGASRSDGSCASWLTRGWHGHYRPTD